MNWVRITCSFALGAGSSSSRPGNRQPVWGIRPSQTYICMIHSFTAEGSQSLRPRSSEDAAADVSAVAEELAAFALSSFFVVDIAMSTAAEDVEIHGIACGLLLRRRSGEDGEWGRTC